MKKLILVVTTVSFFLAGCGVTNTAMVNSDGTSVKVMTVTFWKTIENAQFSAPNGLNASVGASTSVAVPVELLPYLGQKL